MSNFKILVTKFWINILCPFWSFIVNSCYWICRPFKIKAVIAKKKTLLGLELETVMNMFNWKSDNYKDWYPWIITIINKDLEDDCDGAATLAKWWWGEHGIESRLVFIYSSDGSIGHAICVKNDNSIFVSNSEVLELDPNNWKEDLFKKFDNVYSVIIEK